MPGITSAGGYVPTTYTDDTSQVSKDPASDTTKQLKISPPKTAVKSHGEKAPEPQVKIADPAASQPADTKSTVGDAQKKATKKTSDYMAEAVRKGHQSSSSAQASLDLNLATHKSA